MTQSVTESSISPSPFSPFSTYSVASGATSDDAPDLGAFTHVFRALNNFNARVQPNGPNVRSSTPTSSFALSQSDDSDPVQGPSGWTARRLTSYHTTSLPGSPVRGRSVHPSESDATASDYDDGTELEVPIEDENTVDRPSLGYLDQTLTYIAAEREKLAARRELRGNSSTTSDSASPLAVPAATRRKRRRKRNRSAQDPRRNAPADDAQMETMEGEVDGVVDEASADNEDGDTSSSSVDASSSSPAYKTTPATPAILRKEKQIQRAVADHNPRLHHSKSTPTLKPNPTLHVMTTSFDARTIQLRTLAHKLRLLFPSEAKVLSAILSRDFTSALTYADPRGPVPQSQDTLIHVFIDHSNILIGFVTYVKRHLQHVLRKFKQAHLSHAALALVLERGRPVTRRVLVTSSPLYQPMHTAEELGYEVRIYARVPDTGDGADRQRPQHSRNDSAGNNNANTNAGPSRARGRTTTHSRKQTHATASGGAAATASGTANGNATSTDSDTANALRVRYREQGVDELLQLKLHQAIAAVDVVPPGGTIVLATGDGNVGQFNEDGFLGCVRTALKKGWRVELYAWEGGLSRAWSREFGECEGFRIIMLDKYAADLLEIPDGAAGER
ncbi:uncharacterized protein TRAVEDRAFT_171672 [Trametes versicolor FP-101664 SS1]|uniref:uncharacterized protein n=1 Tax=Trametes versicolor (strain FP-101664) TaxID=717944 RepID=UPI000462458F|nr:uncharacterized protein TRAVEDRAFT_171672 [Trametes versicolor FP-101664 SS1]EIW55786.1 hypothetical protein TRAVEDRAFT_171672 [Trametes versicolor FP-101664 SS1]